MEISLGKFTTGSEYLSDYLIDDLPVNLKVAYKP